MLYINGKDIAQNMRTQLAQRIHNQSVVPNLAIILVGNDAPSHLYVKLKEKAAKEVGVEIHKYRFEADASQDEVLQCIDFLREDDDIDGIIVQLPLPQQINTDTCIEAIGALKDVDGFHKENIAQFLENSATTMFPVFPRALILLALEAVGEGNNVLLGRQKSVLSGKTAVIIAQSDIFGAVMAQACRRIGLVPVVVQCDRVPCMQAQLLAADVIFTACGKAGLIDGKYIKIGTIVIDGGISTQNNKTVGDIDAESVADKVSMLSPVPGGVGPVTIACLLENAVEFAMRK